MIDELTSSSYRVGLIFYGLYVTFLPPVKNSQSNPYVKWEPNKCPNSNLIRLKRGQGIHMTEEEDTKTFVSPNTLTPTLKVPKSQVLLFF